MKITKRLCISVICLVLSLTFCVWAIFAWFTNKNDVRGEGISTSVLGPELVDLKVERYRLTRQKDGSYSVADAPIPDTQKTMPSYNDKDEGTTAVLIKLTLTVSDADVACSLSIRCLSADVTVSSGTVGYVSALSNAVMLYNLGAGIADEGTTGGVTENAEGNPTELTIPGNLAALRFWDGTFTGGQAQKVQTLSLSNKWQPAAGENTVSLYLFMDYDSSLITNGLYQLEGISFTTSMSFETDISFTAIQLEQQG